MARVWKARMGQTIAGSNPALSANQTPPTGGVFCSFAPATVLFGHNLPMSTQRPPKNSVRKSVPGPPPPPPRADHHWQVSNASNPPVLRCLIPPPPDRAQMRKYRRQIESSPPVGRET